MWNEREDVGELLLDARSKEKSQQLLCLLLLRAERTIDASRLDKLQMQTKTVATAVPIQRGLDLQDLYKRLLKQVLAGVFMGVSQAVSGASLEHSVWVPARSEDSSVWVSSRSGSGAGDMSLVGWWRAFHRPHMSWRCLGRATHFISSFLHT